jgi:hypothetical protein
MNLLGWHKKGLLALALFALAGLLGVTSQILNSSVLILAALGIAIWGTMLLLLTMQKVVTVDLANLFIADTTIALNSLLSRLDYDARAVIEPPTTAGSNPSLRLFSKVEERKTALFTPLGLDFVFQIEKRSPVALFSMEFDVLSEFLLTMFTDEFRIASGFAMRKEDDLVSVRMTDFVFQDLYEQMEKTSLSSCQRLLVPISSSLACIISKVTHKSVSYDKTVFVNSNTIEVCFRIH